MILRGGFLIFVKVISKQLKHSGTVLLFFLLIGCFIHAQPSSVQIEYVLTGFGKNNLRGILHYGNEEAIFFVVDSLNNHQENQITIKNVPLDEDEMLRGVEFIMTSMTQIASSEGSHPPYYMQTSLIDGVRLSSVDLDMTDEEFILKEEIGTIQWDLQSKTRLINGFNCQKAIGKFGGRTYIAWYTPEIPITTGPWKLDGLPGAIVEASDSKEISFLLSKVQFDLDWPNIEKLNPNSDNLIDCHDYFKLLEQNSIERNKQFRAKLSRGFEARLNIKTNLVQKECD